MINLCEKSHKNAAKNRQQLPKPKAEEVRFEFRGMFFKVEKGETLFEARQRAREAFA